MLPDIGNSQWKDMSTMPKRPGTLVMLHKLRIFRLLKMLQSGMLFRAYQHSGFVMEVSETFISVSLSVQSLQALYKNA